MAIPALIPQGTLNRVRCSVVFSNFPNLNITSPYMSKTFARISFSGVYNNLIPTATGAVSSPEPYVMGSISVGVLRTQPLGAAFQEQALITTNVGPFTVYSDTSNFDPYYFDNGILSVLDPGPFDGTNPEVHLTLMGVYYINSTLWDQL
jgi:hypothetical protein